MIRTFLSLVKIEHTLFALPLALAGAVLGAGGLPAWKTLGLVAVAFAGARASAMAFNRLVDRHFDARNPRTAARELPTGRVTPAQAGCLVAASIVVFVGAAWAINPLCGKLSPVALVVLLGYSYTKRFTMFSHYVLGLALGMAPVAGWLAVTGRLALTPLCLGAGVALWTAGFDTLYACQDVEFDRRTNLHSLPACLGTARAMGWSRASHALSFLFFVGAGVLARLGWCFYPLIALTGLMLVWEHRLVGPADQSRLDLAFFRINSLVSATILLAVSAGLWL
ncbi:MAG: UbiA family prenyltransferase [Deltaproteobacteria bacterium]|nr:UbiA family prenyltransferase [Deltaproteobacteria bacterium]MBW1948438.1 UbiA family prenyltransferase [Deltaproteobacteria bacterium]MBW2347438.1 UbiA family prenyltransferase [Deltaproteobacteria bacterium]